MEIKDINTSGISYNLKGGMRVTNDPALKDTFTQSEKSEFGFLHDLGEKIKNMFSHKEKPKKEAAGWYNKPDGSGSEWLPESSPPPPKDSHGHWIIDTACCAAHWYWVKDSSPAEGPEYGPGFNPTQS